MKSPTEPELWLRHEDVTCREDRLERLRWLATLMPIAGYLTYPGGWVSLRLFEETRYSFACGQYVATILLGLAYLERTLAAMLYRAGRSDLEHANIALLLREAVALGWLDESESRDLDHARAIRNRVAHFRRPFHKETIEHQAVALDEAPDSVVEEDARHVVRAVFRLLARHAA